MMRTAISENKEMVLGYSRLNAETKITSPFLIAWIRLETIYTALQYVSFANWGLPYMGVGRNMLYHKSLFLANNGLVAHADLLSGDDDLFVRDVATATNTTVCLSANSIVDSAAKETWGDYIQQKTRHLSTSVRYKPLIQLLLGVLSASHLLVYFFGAIWVAIFSLGVYHAYIDNFHFYTDGNFKLFFNHFLIRNDAFQNIEPYIIGLLLLRWLLQIGQLIRVTNILQEKNLRKYVFVFDFMLFLYLFVMSFSFLKRDKKW